MKIRELKENEMKTALELVWKVFQTYEAPDYDEDGCKEFYQSIHDEEYIKQLRTYGAFLDHKMIGVISTRNNGNHVALFFVDGEYHKKGIGKQLFQEIVKENTTGCISVNSSPYAVQVYQKLGFIITENEKITNGVRYTPMKITF